MEKEKAVRQEEKERRNKGRNKGDIYRFKEDIWFTEDSEGTSYSEAKRKIFELVPPGGYWRDIPEDIAKEYIKSC